MDEGQNILSASTNTAYGVTGGQESKTTICINQLLLLIESDVSANPAYGTNIPGGIESMYSVCGDDVWKVTVNCL